MQLDSEKLRADRLSLIAFMEAISAFCGDTKVTVIEGTSTSHLLDQLGRASSGGARFDVVVVVGHSNREGIVLSSDAFVSWEAFANWLAPLGPRRLMLVACEAGTWPAATVMFERLPLLRRIFASPVAASFVQGQIMLLMIPHLIESRRPDMTLIRTLQGAVTIATGGQVRHWTRKDIDNSDGELFDLASRLADPIARRLHGAVVGRFW